MLIVVQVLGVAAVGLLGRALAAGIGGRDSRALRGWLGASLAIATSFVASCAVFPPPVLDPWLVAAQAPLLCLAAGALTEALAQLARLRHGDLRYAAFATAVLMGVIGGALFLVFLGVADFVTEAGRPRGGFAREMN